MSAWTLLEADCELRRKIELLVWIQETQSRIDPPRSELLDILAIYCDAGPPGTAGDQWAAVEMALVIDGEPACGARGARVWGSSAITVTPEQPTFQASIPSFLPEEQVRVAHEEGLTITLHLVRSRALA